MITKVEETINEFNMFKKDDLIIVALSGGPDSVALLHILYILKDRLNINIVAAHVNHCLRGEDSDGDEEYVKGLCNQYDIPLYSKRIDINYIANNLGISCEMAGREARYKYFQMLKNKISADKIALAHHANDQAETILMRFMRGSGIEGLTGIKPIRDDIFVRPLIKISRISIENYCLMNNLTPRTDKSNYENVYSRNKIRLEMIPYIERNFNQDITNTINRFADIISIDNDYLEMMSMKKNTEYCWESNGSVNVSKEAFNEHRAILSRILRNSIKVVKGDLTNIEKKHIDDIIDIQKKSTGKILHLPQGISVVNNYKDIVIKKKNQDNNRIDYEELEYKLNIQRINYIENECFLVKMNLLQGESKNKILKKDKFVKYFDYDKLNNDIILRYRRKGDIFSPLGMKGRKKIKDYFMDLKIPKDERSKIPMICFGDSIVWVIGYGISEKYKINNATKTILQIIIEREEK